MINLATDNVAPVEEVGGEHPLTPEQREERENVRFYRCSTCNRLLHHGIFEICLGHRLSPLGHGSFFEWLKIQWWKFRGF